MSSTEDKTRFWSLARRYIELGQRLPSSPIADVEAAAEARIIIAEMNKTKTEMDILLDRNRSP